MSVQHLAEAKRLLDGGAVQTAMAHAFVAHAEAASRQAAALESLVDKLSALMDDDRGHVLRVEVVPR